MLCEQTCSPAVSRDGLKGTCERMCIFSSSECPLLQRSAHPLRVEALPARCGEQCLFSTTPRLYSQGISLHRLRSETVALADLAERHRRSALSNPGAS